MSHLKLPIPSTFQIAPFYQGVELVEIDEVLHLPWNKVLFFADLTHHNKGYIEYRPWSEPKKSNQGGAIFMENRRIASTTGLFSRA
ncbi:MAG: hypothetical protein LRY73_13045 [Bacillus sp. (in: Bacteria)]|nr:hypothetical protein [Bacillus sp. (in: firmicutes)]